MAQNEKRGYALKRGEGTHIDFRGTKMTVKVSQEQSEGAYSLIEMAHPRMLARHCTFTQRAQRPSMCWKVPTRFVVGRMRIRPT